MSSRPANPDIIHMSSYEKQQDLVGEGYTEASSDNWLEIPFDMGVGFPQSKSFVIQVPDNPRTYRVDFDYNYTYGEFFLTIVVTDTTRQDDDEIVFVRKVLPNIIYRVGYMEVLFLEIDITEKWIKTGDDPAASVVGVVRVLEV